MKRATMVAMSNPISASEEDAYNDWYENVHLAEVVSIPGFVAAQRLRLCDIEIVPGAAAPPHRYVALYEIEADDIEAACARMMALSGTDKLRLSPTLDAAGMTAFVYEPTGTRVVASSD